MTIITYEGKHIHTFRISISIAKNVLLYETDEGYFTIPIDEVLRIVESKPA